MKWYSCTLISGGNEYCCTIDAVDAQDAFEQWIEAAEKATQPGPDRLPYVDYDPVGQVASMFRIAQRSGRDGKFRAVKGTDAHYEARCEWESVFEIELGATSYKATGPYPWERKLQSSTMFTYKHQRRRRARLLIMELTWPSVSLNTLERTRIVRL